MNQLFYGENLEVLRKSGRDESVDLIYLDPPFNSKRGYNLLFKTPKGVKSAAQIAAFEDTWHWGEQAEREFDEILHQPNTDVAQLMQALRSFLGENDVMAYLTMMANRLLELKRVLKPTGSLYLHCDPTASHYLKIVLDAVFGTENFRNEIVWHYRRWTGKAKKFQELHDIIFFYTKTNDYKFNVLYTPYTKGSRERKEQGVLHRFKHGEKPYLVSIAEVDKRGVRENDVWQIPFIAPSAKERLGYPTQKPLALLERIIAASSDKGDLVLDPFCGCGTAVHAAQKLKRRWIGIDITHLAISVIEKRLNDAFRGRAKFEVYGTPKDLDAARDLAKRDKYQFQWWAVSLVNAQPFRGKKKGADTGIDGIKFFTDLDHKPRKIIVSVKGGGIKPDDVRALNHVREREKAEIALFISLESPTPAMVKDAASARLYTSVNGKTRVPRVQLLTIAELLSGTKRAQHPDYDPA